jgi:hypothetical protein
LQNIIAPVGVIFYYFKGIEKAGAGPQANPVD